MALLFVFLVGILATTYALPAAANGASALPSSVDRLHYTTQAAHWRPREYPSPDHYARAVEAVLIGDAPGLYGSHISLFLANAVDM